MTATATPTFARRCWDLPSCCRFGTAGRCGLRRRGGSNASVTAAGGGGPLEDFDRANTWFGHKKARRHHFVQVALHGRHLELHAIDEDGRMSPVE